MRTASRIVVVGGGARSGKSRFALSRAMQLGARRVFVATAEALDDEMRSRIARHAEERGRAFTTVEEPRRLAEAITAAAPDTDVVLVDCITLWLSNLLIAGSPDVERPDVAVVEQPIADLVAALRRRTCHVVLVSNEVGLGIVPMAPLSRAYRDAVGRAHQALAAVADELYLAAMGVILRLRPDPVTVVEHGLGLDENADSAENVDAP
jgi:adenosylcobinamide kinase/adenosylcobinamide-phosphate guanylyltransferase